MTLVSANTQQVAYQTKTGWWGTSALGLSFKFKYLVDVVNGSNSQELGQLNAGNIDWSNNFLPGINMLASAMNGGGGYTLKFFYDKSPYMLSANTVWLEPNTSKAPFNNVNFRKAMAYALNPQAIAQSVYGGIATPSTPTGLLPTLAGAGFVDKSVESQLGATFDPAKAKQLLAQSGYDGRTLSLIAPQGWSDWNTAQQVIAQELNAVGIKVQVNEPSYDQRTADITNGTYDLALDNNAGLDASPISYFQRVFQLPIQKQQSSQQNWERINSPADWALVQKAATTSPSDTATLKQIYPSWRRTSCSSSRRSRSGTTEPGSRATPSTGRVPVGNGQRPEHARHVGRLPRRHDHGSGPGAANGGPAEDQLTQLRWFN